MHHSIYRRIVQFTLTFIFLLPALSAEAQTTGSVAGSVRATDTDTPLQGVVVRVADTEIRTFTDREGRFELHGLAPESYTLVFEVLGRVRSEREVRIESGETVRVQQSLEFDPLLLDPLQVTAARQTRTVGEVAAPVRVLDRATLDEIQPTKIGDALAFEPGVDIEGAGPFLGQPVIRGLSGNRVLVLVDGQRLNNAREAINFGGVQPSLVDVERISEIEVLRGPASVLYGTDALGGIINIVTEDPPFPTEGLDVRVQASTSFSSVDSGSRFSGSTEITGSTFGLSLGGTVRDANDYESPVGDVINSAAESVDLYGALEFRPSAGHRLRLKAQRFEAEEVGLPGTSGVFTGSFPTTRLAKVGADYRASAIGFADELQVEFFVQNQEEDFSTLLDLPPFPAGPFTLAVDTETQRVSDVTTVGFGARATSRPWEGHELRYGFDFFRDDVEEDRREVHYDDLHSESARPSSDYRDRGRRREYHSARHLPGHRVLHPG